MERWPLSAPVRGVAKILWNPEGKEKLSFCKHLDDNGCTRKGNFPVHGYHLPEISKLFLKGIGGLVGSSVLPKLSI